MKAAFFSYQYGLRISETNEPKVNADEVLIKIKSAGLCATELHYMYGHFKYRKDPIILGHEGSGIVEKVGESVEKINVGDRVIIDYLKGCGKCEYCKIGKENRCPNAMLYGFDLNGTFAEYIVVSENNIVPMPHNMPFEEGSIIGCAVVTPYHAINVVGGVWDKSIAIIGLGGVGIHGVLLSRLLGARYIIGIDVDERKQDIAYNYGADYFINSAKENPIDVIQNILTEGVDIAFDFVGTSSTINQALNITKPGGTSVIVGLAKEKASIDFSNLIFKEKSIVTTIDHTHQELIRLLKLLSARKISLKSSITHYFTLDKLPEAIELLKNKYEPVIRIVINKF